MIRRLAILLLACCITAPLTASGQDTGLARVFDDHMVLQRETPVAIFGTDAPRQAIHISFAPGFLT